MWKYTNKHQKVYKSVNKSNRRRIICRKLSLFFAILNTQVEEWHNFRKVACLHIHTARWVEMFFSRRY
jgi:hypothetical protein